MELKQLISDEARKIDDAMRSDIEEHTGLDPLLAEILEYGLFSGGKRVRPLLAILCARLCGSHDEAIYRLAIAFEYLHTATLFHDDVIDRAETRRGKPSVNTRYGMMAAILAGDFLHAQSMAIVGRHGGVEALSIFVEATRGMVDGEFGQLRNAARVNQSEADYFSVVRGKTALLIGAACRIGGLYAGVAGEQQQAALGTYGINLGCAFQIVDDLLDYLGDCEKMGKSLGNDLAEGKMTLPLILTLQRADADERTLLMEILRDERQRQGRFQEVKMLIREHRGFTDASVMAERMIVEGNEALDCFRNEKNEQYLDVLHRLSRYVLSRKS